MCPRGFKVGADEALFDLAADWARGHGMDRLPNAADLTTAQFTALRGIVSRSFTPNGQINSADGARLIELGLVQRAMGGWMPTPGGRMASRG